MTEKNKNKNQNEKNQAEETIEQTEALELNQDLAPEAVVEADDNQDTSLEVDQDQAKETASEELDGESIQDQRGQKKDSRWSKFIGNKVYVGLAAAALLAAGGVAGVGAASALVFTHQREAVTFMDDVRSEFGDWEDRFDRDDRDDRYDDADDRAERQAFSQLTTKVDFKTAMDTALKEAGSGFVTSIHLDLENGKAVYEVETFDGTTEKDYTIDADSGSVLRSQTDGSLDADDRKLTQPQKSSVDIFVAAQTKYKNAKISDISYDQDRSGKWIYEVDFLDGDTMKTAYFEADTGNFISDETDRD